MSFFSYAMQNVYVDYVYLDPLASTVLQQQELKRGKNPVANFAAH